ncbi:hypothetical protein CEXT_74811 [Caerostris extrusa]|uniref:Uncharacterized protein n=1 Tax=Caerostris extrusa TaxID=172846 RepID=A0AAV4S6J7_CAEEX|nr:hypothetical protein CEXT_74811 [Caerostris extrusa]
MKYNSKESISTLNKRIAEKRNSDFNNPQLVACFELMGRPEYNNLDLVWYCADTVEWWGISKTNASETSRDHRIQKKLF